MMPKFRGPFILVTMPDVCVCGGGDSQIGTAKDKMDENSPWKKETIVSVCFSYKRKSNDLSVLCW